jgi:hypothetical protein
VKNGNGTDPDTMNGQRGLILKIATRDGLYPTFMQTAMNLPIICENEQKNRLWTLEGGGNR